MKDLRDGLVLLALAIAIIFVTCAVSEFIRGDV